MTKNVHWIVLLAVALGLVLPGESTAQLDRLRQLRKKAEDIAKTLKKGGETTTKPEEAKATATFPALSAKVESTALAPLGTPMFEEVVSQDGTHAAGVALKGSRFAVVVDGVEGPAFDQTVRLHRHPRGSHFCRRRRERKRPV